MKNILVVMLLCTGMMISCLPSEDASKKSLEPFTVQSKFFVDTALRDDLPVFLVHTRGGTLAVKRQFTTIEETLLKTNLPKDFFLELTLLPQQSDKSEKYSMYKYPILTAFAMRPILNNGQQ